MYRVIFQRVMIEGLDYDTAITTGYYGDLCSYLIHSPLVDAVVILTCNL